MATQAPSAQLNNSPGDNPLIDFFGSIKKGIGNVAKTAGQAASSMPTGNNPILNLIKRGAQVGTDEVTKGYQDPTQLPQNPLQYGGELLGMLGLEGGANPAADVKATGQVVDDFGSLVKNPARISLPASIGGAQRESEVQKTIDTVVPGTTATQKYSALQSVMGALGDNIKSVLGIAPKDIPISDIRSALRDKIQPLIDNGTIDEQNANAEISQYITRMLNSSTRPAEYPAVENSVGPKVTSTANVDMSSSTTSGQGSASQYKLGATQGVDKNGLPIGGRLYQSGPSNSPLHYETPDATPYSGTFTPENLPDTVSSPIVFDMKTAGNKAINGLYDSKGNLKENLSPSQQVTLALRNGLDTVISNNHPDVKALTTQQSHLYDATNPLKTLSEKEFQQAQSAANAPKSGTLKFLFGSPSHTAATIGVGSTLASGLGLGAYGAYLAHTGPKNYQFSSGNVSLPGLPDIKDQQGNSLVTNPADYANQIQSINDQEKPLQLQVNMGIPGAKAKMDQLEIQKQTFQNKLQVEQPIFNKYVDTNNKLSELQSAQQLVKTANPQWFQAFGGAGALATGLRAAFVPGYAKWEQQLNNLEKLGVDTSAMKHAGDPETADAAINEAVKSYTNQLKNTITASGGVWPTDQQQTPQTGKEAINAQLKQIISPTPTQAPETQPTPDSFQKLLTAPYQQGVN